ncbi:MAG: flagellar export protein FliJ [Pseudomonadota bacterium]
MRSRDTLIRLQQFKVEERQRDVQDLETMIADFAKKEAELLQMISHEEERCGITDPNHFSYPTTAKASRGRRDNLLRSIDELKVQMVIAEEKLEEEQSEMRKLELMVEKDVGLKPGKAEADSMIIEPVMTAH